MPKPYILPGILCLNQKPRPEKSIFPPSGLYIRLAPTLCGGEQRTPSCFLMNKGNNMACSYTFLGSTQFTGRIHKTYTTLVTRHHTRLVFRVLSLEQLLHAINESPEISGNRSLHYRCGIVKFTNVKLTVLAVACGPGRLRIWYTPYSPMTQPYVSPSIAWSTSLHLVIHVLAVST